MSFYPHCMVVARAYSGYERVVDNGTEFDIFQFFQHWDTIEDLKAKNFKAK